MGVLYFFFCDAAYILCTDVQAGVTGHVGVKYSNSTDIVVPCCAHLNPLKERQLLPVGRRVFPILWLQWLNGSIV